MRMIFARNVNDAWLNAIGVMNQIGVPEDSRNGPVRVAPYPVMTIYDYPFERVLFDPVRDANPIFHLHESLWMLAGSNDATWLDQFVKDFSERYAEPDGSMHGAYGYRWREHFSSAIGHSSLDQLDVVVKILTQNSGSRQAVIQMWDAESDLGLQKLKDRPCNTQIYLRIQNNVLDLNITCRSNDIVWGAYGANIVHFSILQEYLAARIGVGIGKLYQYSWNWHMYENAKHLVDSEAANGWSRYPGTIPLVTNPDTFDDEVFDYVEDPELTPPDLDNVFLSNTAYPMFKANVSRRAGDREGALSWAHRIVAPDWKQATVAWLERRKK